MKKRNKVNVKNLLKRLGIAYQKSRSPNELIIDCVDPSCPNPKNHVYINETTGLWICHRCGVAGNTVVLISIVRKTTAIDAQRLLEEEMPDAPTLTMLKNKLKEMNEIHEVIDHMGLKLFVPVPLHSKLIRKDKYPTFLKERKIPFSLAMRSGVRVCNGGKYNGRLIFPFKCDGSQSFVAYSAMGQKPKTLNPPGGMNDRMIYRYDAMNKSGNGPLVVVEGIFDCLRLQMYGLACVALLGAFLSKNQAILLNDMSYDPIIFMLDGDVRSQAYWKQLRNYILIDSKKVLFAPITDTNKDPDKLSKQEVTDILENGTFPATETHRLREKNSKIV